MKSSLLNEHGLPAQIWNSAPQLDNIPVINTHSLDATAGATSPDGRVVVVRAQAPMVEPVLDRFKQVRLAWRAQLWQLPPVNPRIWAV